MENDESMTVEPVAAAPAENNLLDEDEIVDDTPEFVDMNDVVEVKEEDNNPEDDESRLFVK